MCIENDLLAIKKIFIDYPRLYKVKKQELVKAEQERQDLLHVLELGKLDAIKMGKITRELKQVQIRRRQIKNNLEVLEVISKFSQAFNNNTNKSKQIETVMNTVKNITERDRKYTMRVRTDLQKLVEVGE
ncbi:hypothetical protein AB4Y30_11550 [Ornithinibacillus sp. 4-3]|uniref:Uncharacterized protein n=1 Tax=Ornithinibacillus sp. 4-3 TaxID=3231488 RepID=A0AB39HN26_9BACI